MRRKILRRSLLGVALSGLVVFTLWHIDPARWGIKQMYPNAQIDHLYETPWLVPPFLRSRFPPKNDLYFGRYLAVSISDELLPVDVSFFERFPVFLLELNRCKVIHVDRDTSIRGIIFEDCNIDGLTEFQKNRLEHLHGIRRYALNY
jgi:hypothetical protein